MDFDGARWLKNQPCAALYLTNSSGFDRDLKSRKQMLEIIVVHLQIPVVTRRRHHLPTVASSDRRLAAASLFWLPSAQASMIRALETNACDVSRRTADHGIRDIELATVFLDGYQDC
jgi:hypothetical protein